MISPKYKITLREKSDKPISERKVMTLWNEIFNPLNGVGFFEIERDRWEVLDAKQFTGLTDSSGEEIYEGDVLLSEQFPDVEFKVRAEAGGFVVNTPVKAWVGDRWPWSPLSDEQTISWVKQTCKIKE